jgi:hypothetical protein
MEWGQGDCGAADYYDHGSSELSMDSGLLFGAFDEKWSGAPQPGVAIPAAVEIPVAEWPAFCAWFTENFRSVVVCLERQEQGESLIEARDLPLSKNSLPMCSKTQLQLLRLLQKENRERFA